MHRFLSRFAWYAVLFLCVLVYAQHRRTVRLTAERDRYQANTTALLTENRRYKVDSATMAVDAQTLRLTLEEFKHYRAEDLAKIKAMGIKIRNLEAVAKHEIEVNAPIDAPVRDTVIIRDTVPVVARTVRIDTPFIKMDGIIDSERLVGSIRVPVTLRQAIWIEYKRRWIFWKRVKAVHQTMTSDNPYVEMKYSEYIEISK